MNTGIEEIVPKEKPRVVTVDLVEVFQGIFQHAMNRNDIGDEESLEVAYKECLMFGVLIFASNGPGGFRRSYEESANMEAMASLSAWIMPMANEAKNRVLELWMNSVSIADPELGRQLKRIDAELRRENEDGS